MFLLFRKSFEMVGHSWSCRLSISPSNGTNGRAFPFALALGRLGIATSRGLTCESWRRIEGTGAKETFGGRVESGETAPTHATLGKGKHLLGLNHFTNRVGI